MVDILPFARTNRLVNEIDEFMDKVADAVLVTERTFYQYLDTGSEAELADRFAQIRELEDRADELRRDVANALYTEMLMPDSRADVLSLLDHVDSTLDACVHLLAKLALERPELVEAFQADFRGIMSESVAAMQAMLSAARAYFRQPHAVRDHVHKTSFHDKEGTAIGMRLGKAIYDSDLPLERKMQLGEWLSAVRNLASDASDVGDELAILAVKRAI